LPIYRSLNCLWFWIVLKATIRFKIPKLECEFADAIISKLRNLRFSGSKIEMNAIQGENSKPIIFNSEYLTSELVRDDN